MEITELLPIGTLVKLHQSDEKFMIYGRKITRENTGQVYDYLACLYPYGFVSNEYTAFFNGSSISEVVFQGYEDEEEGKFKHSLKETLLAEGE